MRPIRLILTCILWFWSFCFLIEGIYAVSQDGWSTGGGLYGKQLIWFNDQLILRANGNAVITGCVFLIIGLCIRPRK